jgi:hypothetical protein
LLSMGRPPNDLLPRPVPKSSCIQVNIC